MAIGKLTTHVLDTAHGCPGKNIAISLYDGDGKLIIRTTTNDDGRCDAALLSGDDMKSGNYRLEFSIADYYRAMGSDLPENPFLNIVTITFGIDDADGHYHVPLLASPYGYSTYRGS